MANIESVLFATDFSEIADHACSYAASLARLYNARLYVLHVISNPAEKLYGDLHGEYMSLVADARKKASELMNRYAAELEQVPNHEILIKEGEAPFEILKAIDEQKIDTVVVGSRGHRTIRSMLVGGTTEKLVHSSPCPVIVVPLHDRRRATP